MSRLSLHRPLWNTVLLCSSSHHRSKQSRRLAHATNSTLPRTTLSGARTITRPAGGARLLGKELQGYLSVAVVAEIRSIPVVGGRTKAVEEYGCLSRTLKWSARLSSVYVERLFRWHELIEFIFAPRCPTTQLVFTQSVSAHWSRFALFTLCALYSARGRTTTFFFAYKLGGPFSPTAPLPNLHGATVYLAELALSESGSEYDIFVKHVVCSICAADNFVP